MWAPCRRGIIVGFFCTLTRAAFLGSRDRTCEVRLFWAFGGTGSGDSAGSPGIRPAVRGVRVAEDALQASGYRGNESFRGCHAAAGTTAALGMSSISLRM